MASIEFSGNTQTWHLTREDLELLSDRLYSRGISTLSTDSRTQRRDLIMASRTIRRMITLYERGSGCTLHSILLGGQC